MGVLEHIVDIGSSDNESEDSDLKYRMALTSIGDPVHLIDNEYIIRFINPAFISWLEKLGFNEVVIGKHLFEVFPFLDDKTMKEYESVFSSGKSLHS